MLRFVVYLLLILLVAVVGASFASLNPGDVRLDLAVGFVETRISLAFAVTFAIGWLVGLATMAGGMLKVLNDRRRLRKSVKLAEAEVSNLRRLPLHNDN